jgi:hypothetical protein
MGHDASSPFVVPEPIRRFAEVVEQEELHGLAFQHLNLCRRRAWFHLNRIDYAHLEQTPKSSISDLGMS